MKNHLFTLVFVILMLTRANPLAGQLVGSPVPVADTDPRAAIRQITETSVRSFGSQKFTTDGLPESQVLMDTVAVQNSDGWTVSSLQLDPACPTLEPPEVTVGGPILWGFNRFSIVADQNIGGTGCYSGFDYNTAPNRWVISKTFTMSASGTASVNVQGFRGDGGSRIRVNGIDVGVYGQFNLPATGRSALIPVTAGANTIEIETRDAGGPNWLEGRVSVRIPATWACNADGILSQDGEPTNTRFIDLVTGGSTVGPQIAGRTLNALAYNVVDDYLYAWDNTIVGPGGERLGIVRIGGDGAIQELGLPVHPELDPTIPFPVGDIDNNGHYWASNAIGGSVAARWFQIDLNPGPTFMQVLDWGLVAGNATGIPTGIFIGSGDWAWVPGGGNNLWRVMLNNTNNNWHLIRFDRGTGIHNDNGILAGFAGQGITTFGAVYADEDFVYASNNITGDIFRIDVTAGTASFFTGGPPSNNNDGARCAVAPINTDFGDAPASYGTLLGDNGARHGIREFVEAAGTSPLMLGDTVSNEPDGQPGQTATGDIDDGVALLAPYLPGGGRVCTGTLGSYTTSANEHCAVLSVANTGTANAQVVGWLDSEGDGDYTDAGNRSVPINNPAVDDGTFTTGNSPAGTTRNIIVVWQGLPSSLPLRAYFRFRVTSDASFLSDASPQPIGAVSDGEVEDYVLLQPTAANVSISGRVLTAGGRGIANARVALIDSFGIPRTVATNPFGYYSFADVPAGQTYIVMASAKGYVFDTQTISVADDITGLNFIALE